ncbi:uncharacterized protein LOC110990102 isoform X2 [Acanthaster planci]|uniref:Uncharacterized protein LOC110990102 isoform X2 n=1 Tax=Acanthaster planci TaxID=133434 RepID=A0A8B8A3Z9_ACAPL|nr:uncharacterized protein LOC110990102 isoform X2 [Acanthaster planci]
MMEQGVANEWAASVESTEPDSDKFGLTEKDEDDSDVSRSKDSEAGSKETQDPSDSHSDSDEEQEQWMEKTAGVKGDSSVVGPLPVCSFFWHLSPDRVRR